MASKASEYLIEKTDDTLEELSWEALETIPNVVAASSAWRLQVGGAAASTMAVVAHREGVDGSRVGELTDGLTGARGVAVGAETHDREGAAEVGEGTALLEPVVGLHERLRVQQTVRLKTAPWDVLVAQEGVHRRRLLHVTREKFHLAVHLAGGGG